MRKTILLTAAMSSAMTIAAMWSLGLAQAPPKATVKLENKRVRVSEIVYAPGVPRERHIRRTDQVIVFMDDCRYERKDSATGEKTVRERKSGEVIWHDKGEDAPQLINLGTKPYRTTLIEIE
jgi:hypothetical protein